LVAKGLHRVNSPNREVCTRSHRCDPIRVRYRELVHDSPYGTTPPEHKVRVHPPVFRHPGIDQQFGDGKGDILGEVLGVCSNIGLA
jgi:hypothetical protein